MVSENDFRKTQKKYRYSTGKPTYSWAHDYQIFIMASFGWCFLIKVNYELKS